MARDLGDEGVDAGRDLVADAAERGEALAAVPVAASVGFRSLPTMRRDQLLNAGAEVVSDGADALERLSLWVRDVPFDALDARHERTGFATAHRDQHLHSRGHGIGEQSWCRSAEIDADLHA